MSKETFYFSHDYNARNDIKIKRLIVKHGYEGYGLYWALIEDLYQNANALQSHCDENANALSVECDGITDAMRHEMRHEINRNAIKERKGKENKGKNIVDTNVSKSDAPHPTQKRINYKVCLCFFDEKCKIVFQPKSNKCSTKSNKIEQMLNKIEQNRTKERKGK